jgi:hypothetical protein
MTKSSVITKVFIPWRSIVQISEGIMGVPSDYGSVVRELDFEGSLNERKKQLPAYKEVHHV